MENNPQKFIRYFVVSMVLSAICFCLWAAPITIYWYDLPFNLDELVCYLLAMATQAINWQPDFYVLTPAVAVATMIQMGQTPPPEIPLFEYLHIMRLQPNGWIYLISSYWLVVSVLAAFVIAYKKTSAVADPKRQTHIRGAAQGTSRELAKSLQSGTTGIVIGNLHLPLDIETRHFIILGTTGTGKSYLLMAMLQNFKKRAVKMVILDRKGEFYSAFSDPDKDALFNPYDVRHCHWNIYNEFGLPRSLDRIPERLRDMADSLFSVAANNHNAHFYQAAADVFCSAICYLALQGKTTAADITAFFAGGGNRIVEALLTLPPGLADGLAHLGQDGTDEHSGSILSTLTERIKDFAAFTGKDGDFAVRDWMRYGQGNMYISTAGENDQRYRSITTMLLDIIGQEVKATSESKTTCLAVIIDELASLPPLKTLSFLLNEGRSKGVCVVIANQTFSKIKEIYGDTGAKNIFANTNTKFIFRLPEPTDAKYVSDACGEQEVLRKTKSQNETDRGGMFNNTRGISISEQITREAIYLPSQIQNLAKRHAIVMIPDAPTAEFELPTMQFTMHHPLFAPTPSDEISARDIAVIMPHMPAAAQPAAQAPAPETKQSDDDDLWI